MEHQETTTGLRDTSRESLGRMLTKIAEKKQKREELEALHGGGRKSSKRAKSDGDFAFFDRLASTSAGAGASLRFDLGPPAGGSSSSSAPAPQPPRPSQPSISSAFGLRRGGGAEDDAAAGDDAAREEALAAGSEAGGAEAAAEAEAAAAAADEDGAWEEAIALQPAAAGPAAAPGGAAAGPSTSGAGAAPVEFVASVELEAAGGAKARRGGRQLTGEQRAAAVAAHRAHLLCLTARAARLSAAADDPLLQATLLSRAPPCPAPPRAGPAAGSLTAGAVAGVASWLRASLPPPAPARGAHDPFSAPAPAGASEVVDLEADDDAHGDADAPRAPPAPPAPPRPAPLTPRSAALSCGSGCSGRRRAGGGPVPALSATEGAVLFVAALRALGARARLVCSLHPVSYKDRRLHEALWGAPPPPGRDPKEEKGAPASARAAACARRGASLLDLLETICGREPAAGGEGGGAARGRAAGRPGRGRGAARGRGGRRGAVEAEAPSLAAVVARARRGRGGRGGGSGGGGGGAGVAGRRGLCGARWAAAELWGGAVDDPAGAVRAACGPGAPPAFVVGLEAGRAPRELSARYAPRWSAALAERRAAGEAWAAALAALRLPGPEGGPEAAAAAAPAARAPAGVSAEDIEEDRCAREEAELAGAAQDEPVPTTLAAAKSHPQYVLERHLKKYEGLHPRAPVGFIGKEAVYPRSAVRLLHTRERWLRELRQVREGEEPFKVVKHKPRGSGSGRRGPGPRGRPVGPVDVAGGGGGGEAEAGEEGGPALELFGEWQTDPWLPPAAAGGKVPRGPRGHVELWTPRHVPRGCVHLPQARAWQAAKALGVDYADAMTGFEVRQGRSVPKFEGVVVCAEFAPAVRQALAEQEGRREEKERARREAALLDRWGALLRAAAARRRLAEAYGPAGPAPPQPHGSGSASPAGAGAGPGPGRGGRCERHAFEDAGEAGGEGPPLQRCSRCGLLAAVERM
eukprot:tig00000900_g5375.t1